MIYGGPVCYMGNFIEAMGKYADVHGTNVFTTFKQSVPYETSFAKFTEVNIQDTNTMTDFSKYDYIVGLDNGCIPAISQLGKLGFKAGCLLLDYPTHTFKHNKDFVASTGPKWKEWGPALQDMKFVLHCRENVQENLSEELRGIPSLFHPLPCKIIEDDIDMKNPIEPNTYIMYSGAVTPAKGVHHIISALGMIENAPSLIVVGQGDEEDEMGSFANFLGVDYRQYHNISDAVKFKMYRGALAVVYGHDTGVIPGLCGLEGIGVGKNLICWDFPEHRIMYRSFADYVAPLDISQFAWFIEEEINNPKDNSRGIEYVKNKCSFDSWAKTVYEFLEKQ